MNAPQYRVCAPVDSTCPVVGSPDATFATSSGATSQVVTPLFPFASSYSAYAGVCSNDEPAQFSGADTPVTVPAGGNAVASMTLPAMVVRLHTGTTVATAEERVPAGSHLVVTDTRCNLRYTTTLAASPVINGGSNDTGLLAYPGMPYGVYTVCYDTGTGLKTYSTTVTNKGSGEIIDLLAGSVNTTAGTAC
jgi:hypothetical protein